LSQLERFHQPGRGRPDVSATFSSKLTFPRVGGPPRRPKMVYPVRPGPGGALTDLGARLPVHLSTSSRNGGGRPSGRHPLDVLRGNARDGKLIKAAEFPKSRRDRERRMTSSPTRSPAGLAGDGPARARRASRQGPGWKARVSGQKKWAPRASPTGSRSPTRLKGKNPDLVMACQRRHRTRRSSSWRGGGSGTVRFNPKALYLFAGARRAEFKEGAWRGGQRHHDPRPPWQLRPRRTMGLLAGGRSTRNQQFIKEFQAELQARARRGRGDSVSRSARGMEQAVRAVVLGRINQKLAGLARRGGPRPSRSRPSSGDFFWDKRRAAGWARPFSLVPAVGRRNKLEFIWAQGRLPGDQRTCCGPRPKWPLDGARWARRARPGPDGHETGNAVRVRQ